MQPKTTKTIAVCLGLVASYVCLYLLRAHDDNRLASWDWILSAGDIWRVFAIAIAGAVIAAGLSRFHLPSPRVTASIAFIVSALLWHTPETIVDAGRYFIQAKYLELHGPVAFLRDWGSTELLAWTDLPLIPFLYGMMFRVFGEERLLVQVMNAVFFCGTAWLTAQIGRALWDEFTGRAGALLLLAMPMIFAQSPLMLVDMGSMFFLALASYAFIRAVLGGAAHWVIGSGIVIALSALCKYSMWPMLSVLGIILAVIGRERGRGAIQRGMLAIALGVGLLGLALWPMREVVLSQIALLREYQGPGLGRWGESFASTFLFQIHPAVTLAALASLWFAIKRRDPRYLIAFFLPLLAVIFQIKRSRYLLPMLPMLGLMSAYGLASIREQGVKRVLALGPAAMSILLVLVCYIPFLERYDTANLKAAALIMDRIDGNAVEVITLPLAKSAVNPAMSVPLLDLYLSKPIRYSYTRKPSLPEDEIAVSPLRFTWQYRNPPYYQTGRTCNPIYAVIYGDASDITDDIVPQGYSLRRRLEVSTGFFAYSPAVMIFTR